MEIKVQILTRCENCDGDAYFPIAEVTSYTGEPYTRYEMCPSCQGSGRQTKWISLEELARLLEELVSMEPDLAGLASQHPTSQYTDSRESAGI